jgi:AraC family transcriptional regulator of adaptative response/methylated-DNA-[protein]-cysteine methyltransferase
MMTDETPETPESPEAPFDARIAQAIHYLVQHREDQPELADVAHAAGLAPHHFQRLFTRWVGVSPKKFLQYMTLGAAKERLTASASVLDAALDAGLSGPGRLHDLFVTINAATPGEFKARGAGMEFRYGFHPSPFGESMITVTERGVAGVSFTGQKSRAELLAEQQNGWDAARWTEDAAAARPYLSSIFPEAETPAPEPLSVFLRGTQFQLLVWEALLRIPPGALVSYGQLAAHLGRPKSARAVGTACGSNLVGLLIPCHRVIRDTGVVTGYRWGPEKKRAILAWEAARAA